MSNLDTYREQFIKLVANKFVSVIKEEYGESFPEYSSSYVFSNNRGLRVELRPLADLSCVVMDFEVPENYKSRDGRTVLFANAIKRKFGFFIPSMRN